MAPYLRIAVRALGVGAIIVTIAVVSRQVYLRVAAEADLVGADEEPAAMMLIRCETMHFRLQNRYRSADTAAADEPPRARCESLELGGRSIQPLVHLRQAVRQREGVEQLRPISFYRSHAPSLRRARIVAAAFMVLCKPIQSVFAPGSPSLLRPKKPPSDAIRRII